MNIKKSFALSLLMLGFGANIVTKQIQVKVTYTSASSPKPQVSTMLIDDEQPSLLFKFGKVSIRDLVNRVEEKEWPIQSIYDSVTKMHFMPTSAVSVTEGDIRNLIFYANKNN